MLKKTDDLVRDGVPYRLSNMGLRDTSASKKKGPHLILVGILGKLSQIRKVHQAYQENQESSLGKLGKFIRKIRKIRKAHLEDQENSFTRLGKLGKFIRKISPQYQENPRPYQENSSSILGKFRLKKQVPGGKNTFSNYGPKYEARRTSRGPREISRSEGMYNPIHSDLRQCTAILSSLIHPQGSQRDKST